MRSKMEADREVGEPTRRALVGRRHVRGGHPHALGIERSRASPTAALTVRISRVADPADHPALGDATTLGGQGDGQIESRVGRGVGEVLGRRPDRRARPEARSRATSAAPSPHPPNRKLPGVVQLGHHLEPPVQIVAHRLHAEELLGVGHPVTWSALRRHELGGPTVRLPRPSVPRDLRPRQLLVDPDVAGQPEDALAEDVALDLRGAALDRVGPRPDEHLAGRAGRPDQAQRLGPCAWCSRSRPWRRPPAGRCTARRPACSPRRTSAWRWSPRDRGCRPSGSGWPAGWSGAGPRPRSTAA